MAHATPLPLAQQILAWILQALGHTAEAHDDPGALDHTSRTILRTALQGEHMLDSWDAVLDELVSAMDATPTEAQRTALAAGLREWDRRVGILDTRGLTLQERLPAVIKAAIPGMGVRFGAAAALADDPQVADWLCEPLHPKTFGRVVQWLLEQFRPEWRTWEDRVYELSRAKVATRRTIERWRAGRGATPNAATIVKLAKALGARRRALALLRGARLLAALRASLIDWGGAELVEECATAIGIVARTARQAFSSPLAPAELAELYAQTLESEQGSAVLPHLLPQATASAAELVGRLRDAATRLRAGSDPLFLRPLIAQQVLVPHPLVVAGIESHLADHRAHRRSVEHPLDVVQAEWASIATLKVISSATTMGRVRPDGAQVVRDVPTSVRERATAMLSSLRHVVGHPDRPRLDERDSMALFLEIGLNLGEHPDQVVEELNAGLAVGGVPAMFERFVGDEQLDAYPHLLAERARRLAENGDAGGAAAAWRRWSAAPGLRTTQEKAAIAIAAVALAHEQLDSFGRVLHALSRVRRAVRIDEEARAQVESMERQLPALRATVLTRASSLLAIAEQLHAGSDSPLDAIVLLLPLAIRLDCVASVTQPFPLERSTRFGDALRTALQSHPTHGPAWATLAVWQQVTGDSPSFALKQAEHFGSRSVYEKEMERLGLDPG